MSANEGKRRKETAGVTSPQWPIPECVRFAYLDGFPADGADDRRSDDAAGQVLGRLENHVLRESLRECVRVGTRVDELRGHRVDQVIVHPPEKTKGDRSGVRRGTV